MGLKKNQIVSAQVVLKPASGKVYDSQTAITSENIALFLPSPEAVPSAQRAFAEAGFSVDNAVGNSFAITAPVITFEKFFGTKLSGDARGGVKAAPKALGKAGTRKQAPAGEESTAGRELPLSELPENVSRHLAWVTFGEAPDFGPTSY
jgi:hypothetical protein